MYFIFHLRKTTTLVYLADDWSTQILEKCARTLLDLRAKPFESDNSFEGVAR